jgi:anthranilate phosphoribosyltransferase
MSITQALRTLARADGGEGELGPQAAAELFARLLDGAAPELELGAVLAALAMRPLAAGEIAGFARAAGARVARLAVPAAARARGVAPVCIPSYGGTAAQANLMPALALLLARFGVPVLVHGPLDAPGRVAGATVLRELGVLPCASLQEAQSALEEKAIAFAPTALLAPALAQLVALRARLGVATCAQSVARLLEPFAGRALRLVPAASLAERAVLAQVLEEPAAQALLFVGAEGEAFAGAQWRPAIELHRAGERRVLFEAESGASAAPAAAPPGADARAAAHWAKAALAGKVPLPAPLANLLACCLYGSGYCEDFNQSKAIVAVRARAVAAA